MAIHWSGGRLITFLDKSDPSVPTLVSQLINEISPQVSAEYQGLPPDIEATAEHADIYDFGISLSSSLHNCKANGNQRFVSSLITTMLGAFIKNFWPASIVLDDPLVALPRHPVEGYDPLLRFSIYRRPRLVLFAHVEEPSGSDVETSDDDDEEEEESSDVDDAPSYSSSRRMTASEFCADVQMDGKGKSTTYKELNAGPGASNSVAPLSEVGDLEDTEDDIYLQWSILTGAYADFYLMGVICVGTNDTVWGTMASMLYQRRAWGISQPVFSLFLDGESTVVSAIVSWLSDDTHPTDLPNVLATCLAHYDLSVPDQSLTFSCLLRRLNSHITEMQTLFERVIQSWYLESAGPPLYSWRADTFSNSQFAESGRLWRNEDNIRNWAQGCETERSGSSSSSMVEQGEEAQKEDGINLDRPVKQPTSSQAYSTNIHNHQDIGTMTDSVRRSLRSKVGNTPDNSPPPSVQPAKRNDMGKGKGKKKASNSNSLANSSTLRKGDNPESLANSSAPSDSSSLNIPAIHTPDGSDGGNTPNSRRLSCSEFCRSDYTKDKSNGRVAKYLGQRNIFPMVHPIGTIDGMPIPGERVNKHVEDFKRFTDIPKSALLGMIKAKLTSQWGESLRREISGLANTLSSNELKFVTSQSVNESIMSNISDRFEALLYISIRARQQAEDVYRLTLPEAAVRRQWDILMMEATSNMKELNIDAAVEQTIRLPQNTNLEAVRAKGSFINDTQISGHSTWRGLILDVRNSDFVQNVGRTGPNGKWRKDLPTIIYNSLITRNSKHYEMERDEDVIRDMQSEEPQQARCDGMVSLSVQVFDAHSESASQRKCIEHLRKLALVDLAASAATGDSQIGQVSDMTLAVENNDIIQSSRTQISMIQGGEKEGWENVDEDEGNDELLPSESVDALHPLDQTLAVEKEDPLQPSPEMLEAMNEEGAAGRLRPRKKKEPKHEIKAKAQAGSKKRIISGDLKLPLLVQEYKRFLSDDDKKGNAVNQARMDIAASLKFLAALGIYDFSVYTIATDGTRGTLCYGYMEQGKYGEPDVGYIYEHNTRTFDIANPVDVFNLAITFGHICVENGNVLRDKFNLVADGLKNDLKDAQAISKRFWTAAAQNISMKAGFRLVMYHS